MAACWLDLGGGEGDSEARVRVDEGEQVAAQSIAQAHHGIAGEHFKRWMFAAFGLAGFAFAGDGFVVAAGIQSSGGMAHFVRVAGDDAPMAETLGSAMSCCLHQGRSKTRSLSLPRLGNCPRSWRISLTSAGGPVAVAGVWGAGFGSQGCAVVAGLAHCFQRYRILRLTSKASQAAAVPCWLKKPRILRRC